MTRRTAFRTATIVLAASGATPAAILAATYPNISTAAAIISAVCIFTALASFAALNYLIISRPTR